MARDNSKALGELSAAIAKLRELETLPGRVAPRIAKRVHEVLSKQIAEAKFPSGSAWPDTQDGRKALRNAAAALTVRAMGNVIVARLSGPEARHSVGAVRGNVQRQILPTAAGQLRSIGEAVKLELADAMKEAIK